MINPDEYCKICGEDAIVGMGAPPVWLCVTHFEEALAETGRLLDRARSLA